MSVVWITGARGFLGMHAAADFARAGWEVAGVGHGNWAREDADRCGVRHWMNGEIAADNLEQLRGRTGPPDVVVHLAGGSSVGISIESPLEDFERTCATTARLLSWLRKHAPATRIIAASSAAVYGNGHRTPIAETAAVAPYSPYGLHKCFMEQLVLQYAELYGIRSYIVRFFSLYGPGLRKQLLWDCCARLASGVDPLLFAGTGDERRDWLHVADAATMLRVLAERESLPWTVVNGGTGVSTPISEIIGAVREAWGSRAQIQFSGSPRVGDPAYLVADPSRLPAAGLAPVHKLADGLREYVAWYRTQVSQR